MATNFTQFAEAIQANVAQVIVGKADVTEKYCEREEGAARMIDANKGCMRDDVERLLAAIVRMPPPADIGEEAGGVPQAFFVAGLVEAGGRHEFAGPVRQFLAMAGRA